MKTALSRFRFFLQRFLNSRSTETGLNDELQSYVQHEIDAKIRDGVEPVEARRQAMVEFGGVEQVKEVVRLNRTGAWIDSLLQDVRYAFRTLSQARFFSLSVIVSLSLGIGVTVTAFAFINALMFRPFPGIQQQKGLVELRVTRACDGRSPCWFPNPDDYAALHDGMDTLSSLTGYATGSVVYEARLAEATFVLPGYFETLKAHPAIGRSFTPDDTDGVILSHTLWKREFAGDPDVVGKSIRIGGRSVPVIGIAPPEFQGLRSLGLGSTAVEFWMPMASGEELATWGSSGPFVEFIGRRQPGKEFATIRAQAEVVFSEIAEARSMVTTPGRADAVEVTTFTPSKRPAAIAIVMLVPILILLISCMNAANMLFGRAAVREREMAIRLSMGAGRWRVIRQLLIESLVLSVAAAAVSLPIASSALKLASRAFLGMPMPLDLPVLAGTLLTAFACAFGFGWTPALRMTSLNPGRTIAGNGSPVQARIRRGLVIGQVALSLALLAVGTQLVSSLLSMGGAAGIDGDRLLLATFNLDQIQMSADEANAFYQRVADRVAKLPQAEAVGVGPALWFFGGRVIKTSEINRLNAWAPDTPPGSAMGIRGGAVDTGMFQAVGMPLVEGRWFNDEDRQPHRPQVVIVNRAFEEKVMKGPAVGRVFRLAGRNQKYPSSFEVTIVGVVENFSEPRNERNGSGPGGFVYIPTPIDSEPARVLYVRSAGHAASLSAAVAKAVHEMDPRVPIGSLGSLDELNYQSLPEARLAQGAEAFGFVALVLATFGIYGVMSFSVSQRSREFAIRIALGAEGKGILRMVLKQAMTLASIGAAAGGILAVIASLTLQVINRAPLGIHRLAFAASGLLLLAAMLLAAAIPAIRASRVDPVDNLRQN